MIIFEIAIAIIFDPYILGLSLYYLQQNKIKDHMIELQSYD